MAKTVYDLLEAAAKLDGSPTANEDIRAEMKKHGHDSGKTAGQHVFPIAGNHLLH